VLYVDNDPIVLVHARAVLSATAAGRTAYLDADLRDPDVILRQAAEVFDLTRPTALLLFAVLHFVPDEWRPAESVAGLLAGLGGDSCLAMSHLTPEYEPHAVDRLVGVYRDNGLPCVARSADTLAAGFFANLELVDPGVVPIAEWRPADDVRALPARQDVPLIGGVGRLG
jgi:hypothetical protein